MFATKFPIAMNALPKVSHFATTNLCVQAILSAKMVSLWTGVTRHGNDFVCKMFTHDLSIVKKTAENGDGLDGHMIDLSIVFKKKSHLHTPGCRDDDQLLGFQVFSYYRCDGY